jgi:D-alanine transaminase/branched-chain amino acid aminotransferase
MAYSILNGQLIDEKEANVSVNDLSVCRGYGVFDYFRTREGVSLHRREHLDRLFWSAGRLRLNIPYSLQQLEHHAEVLVKKNGFISSGVRIIVTGGYSEDAYSIGEPTVIITEKELHIDRNLPRGIRLITHSFQREMPDVKTTNYLTGIFMQHQIRKSAADDVLYVYEGNIRECPRSNIFIVTKDNTLITPEDSVLYGITRKNIIEHAGEIMKIECRSVLIEELYAASEVFISSTSKRIVPVYSVNDSVIGKPGLHPVTTKLYQLLLEQEDKIVRAELS